MKNSLQRTTKPSFRIPKGYDGTAVTSRTLSGLLPNALAHISARQNERPDLIIASWKEIVGPAISQLTQAVSFIDGVLKVKVKNSALHSLLYQNEKWRILAALKHRFPNAAISDVQFQIG